MIRVAQIGLGPIGSAVARQVVHRDGLELVAAVDVDPAKAGRDVGAFLGGERSLGIPVADSIHAIPRTSRPDVAMLCTRSSLSAVWPDIEALLAHRLPIVSTTEELAYPWYMSPELAARVDRRARDAGVAVLGTGVNPGFAMDALPVMLTGVCERIDSIRVDRVQDAGRRRLPFQRKIGAGLDEAAFAERAAAGTVRHVGLTESIAMIGAALGWTFDRITDDIRPRIADADVSSGALTVRRGQVAGIIQDGVGYRDGAPVVELHMEAYLGAPESYDAVHIRGVPTFTSRVDGGFHGDVATASVAVNAILKVLAASPGLHTMLTVALAPPNGRVGLKP